MKCPYCETDNDKVVDSRTKENGFAIRRRRYCTQCARRYTTYERIEAASVKVVKKDGTRAPFEREKLRTGIEKACWKRPISADAIEDLIRNIEDHVDTECENEVESQQIGEIVMHELRKIDQVAFVRFASVYREFKDVSDFVDELQQLRESRETSIES